LRLLADACPDPEGMLAARGPSPAEEAEANEALDGLLARLPDERLRLIVRLRAEGLSVREVARRINLSRQRVEELLLRARRLVFAGRGG
jgi:RNA polymerase sigma factor (sigma-70 family)